MTLTCSRRPQICFIIPTRYCLFWVWESSLLCPLEKVFVWLRSVGVVYKLPLAQFPSNIALFWPVRNSCLQSRLRRMIQACEPDLYFQRQCFSRPKVYVTAATGYYPLLVWELSRFCPLKKVSRWVEECEFCI